MLLQAYEELTDQSRELPWEDGKLSKQHKRELGSLRAPIQRLLNRDPQQRATVRQFALDMCEVSGQLPCTSAALSGTGHSGSFRGTAEMQNSRSFRRSFRGRGGAEQMEHGEEESTSERASQEVATGGTSLSLIHISEPTRPY